jgi:hypothetical protein
MLCFGRLSVLTHSVFRLCETLLSGCPLNSIYVIQEPRTRVFHSPWQNSLEAANTPQCRSLQTQYGVDYTSVIGARYESESECECDYHLNLQATPIALPLLLPLVVRTLNFVSLSSCSCFIRHGDCCFIFEGHFIIQHLRSWFFH